MGCSPYNRGFRNSGAGRFGYSDSDDDIDETERELDDEVEIESEDEIHSVASVGCKEEKRSLRSAHSLKSGVVVH